MYSNNFLKIIFILFFIIPIIQTCNRDFHFVKTRWLEKKDSVYPYRDVMIDDLVTNYELTGLTYQQLKDLLGQPDSLSDKNNEVVYEIKIEYDIDIDPVYTKKLIFEFSPDSIVRGFKIEEYRRAAPKDNDLVDLTMKFGKWNKSRRHAYITVFDRYNHHSMMTYRYRLQNSSTVF
jgi:hypothetical protein